MYKAAVYMLVNGITHYTSKTANIKIGDIVSSTLTLRICDSEEYHIFDICCF